MQQVAEPRLATIEGQKTLIVERVPPIHASLDRVLAAMFAIRVANDIRPGGTSVQCERDRQHRFATLREGGYLGPDGQAREVRVEMCRDCGACCVRDVSFDVSIGGEAIPRGGAAPRRHDIVLGWFTGKRRAGREYR